MRVAELCKRLEISADWLKRLERTGTIPPARRDLNGHRRYGEDDLERLRELLLRRKNEGD
jgi:DNA-binding transcriptional MerR regulator